MGHNTLGDSNILAYDRCQKCRGLATSGRNLKTGVIEFRCSFCEYTWTATKIPHGHRLEFQTNDE